MKLKLSSRLEGKAESSRNISLVWSVELKDGKTKERVSFGLNGKGINSDKFGRKIFLKNR